MNYFLGGVLLVVVGIPIFLFMIIVSLIGNLIELTKGEEMDKVKFWLGINGLWLGVALIGIVSGWDLVITGTRGFFEYSIGYKGIVLIWLGLALVVSGTYYSETWGKK